MALRRHERHDGRSGCDPSVAPLPFFSSTRNHRETRDVPLRRIHQAAGVRHHDDGDAGRAGHRRLPAAGHRRIPRRQLPHRGGADHLPRRQPRGDGARGVAPHRRGAEHRAGDPGDHQHLVRGQLPRPRAAAAGRGRDGGAAGGAGQDRPHPPPAARGHRRPRHHPLRSQRAGHHVHRRAERRPAPARAHGAGRRGDQHPPGSHPRRGRREPGGRHGPADPGAAGPRRHARLRRQPAAGDAGPAAREPGSARRPRAPRRPGTARPRHGARGGPAQASATSP